MSGWTKKLSDLVSKKDRTNEIPSGWISCVDASKALGLSRRRVYEIVRERAVKSYFILHNGSKKFIFSEADYVKKDKDYRKKIRERGGLWNKPRGNDRDRPASILTGISRNDDSRSAPRGNAVLKGRKCVGLRKEDNGYIVEVRVPKGKFVKNVCFIYE